MKSYQASDLEGGNFEVLRLRLFTRWRDAKALQDHTDWMSSQGMVAIYCEFNPDHGFREIYWSPPTGSGFEVRSGRTPQEFRQFADQNQERGWPLLTLHRSADGYLSAVWVTSDALDSARQLLSALGIGLASQS
ncbi:MAG: hypothetical protein AAGH89_03650 [Verrucomicrobiota bacterium]